MRLRAGLTRIAGATAAVTLLSLSIGTSAAETAIERGAYLVTTIGSCGNCHSPRNAALHLAAGMELSGGFTFDEDIGRVVGANITPDKEVGIGA
jgi:mono/diheme cytochrome c family protein